MLEILIWIIGIIVLGLALIGLFGWITALGANLGEMHLLITLALFLSYWLLDERIGGALSAIGFGVLFGATGILANVWLVGNWTTRPVFPR